MAVRCTGWERTGWNACNIKINRTIISSAVLYECETWCLTLREHHRLKGFENQVNDILRIFGPKRDEATVNWRRLRNEMLHDRLLSPSIILVIKSKKMRRAGHVQRMGVARGAYRVLVGRTEEKKPPGKPERRRNYNIKMGLQDIGWGGVDWMAQHRDKWRAHVNVLMNHKVS